VSTPRILAVLLFFALAAPVWADHGGPLASVPLRPLTVALITAGLTLVAVLLLVVIVRLLARQGRGGE